MPAFPTFGSGFGSTGKPTSGPGGSSAGPGLSGPAGAFGFGFRAGAGAPDVLKMLFTSIVVTEQTTSIGRDKFDLQILNARLREINDAYNPLVIQAVVDGQEQRALSRGPAAQDLRHSCGQFGCRDLL